MGGRIVLRFIFLINILFIYECNIAIADDHSNGRGIGMSKASMVSSFGINAYGINPANFDYHKNFTIDKKDLKLINKKENPSKGTWEISIMSVGGGYGSDASIDFYNNYIKYLSINRETFTNLFTDINSVLNFRQNILPNNKTQVNYDFELKWFSVNYSSPKIGALNFTIIDKAGLNTNANSKDEEMPNTFSIIYHGNAGYDLVNVQLNQAEAIAWWIRKYNLGYAKQFDFKSKSGISSISIGVSGGMVNGFGNIIAYSSSLKINTYNVKRNSSGVNHVDSLNGKQDFYSEAALTDFFNDYRDGTKSHFTFFPKPAGTGYSFDFGAAMQIGSQWRIAASVTDLGKITWNYHTYVNKDTSSFAYYNFDLSKTDPTYNRFVNGLDGLATRDTVSGYTTDMPTKYRAGIMFQPSDKLLLEADWVKGTNNLPGNSDANVFSAGTEYYPVKFIPVRTGVSVGGPGSFYFSIGAGLKLKHFTLDIAAFGINQIIANKRFSISLSSKLIL